MPNAKLVLGLVVVIVLAGLLINDALSVNNDVKTISKTTSANRTSVAIDLLMTQVLATPFKLLLYGSLIGILALLGYGSGGRGSP